MQIDDATLKELALAAREYVAQESVPEDLIDGWCRIVFHDEILRLLADKEELLDRVATLEKVKVHEISEHGEFDDLWEAVARKKELGGLEGNDNLQYIVKIQNGKYVVVLLAGCSDDSM